MRRMLVLAVISLGLAVAAHAADRVAPRQGDMQDWLSGGNGYNEQHFSALSQINSDNVASLGLAWSLDLPGEQSLEATPLAVDGVLYFTGQMSKIYAVAAVSGKLLWTYDPKSYLPRPRALRYMFPVNRGVAYWKGRVFAGTLDGRLIAVDGRTGKLLWSVRTVDEQSTRLITGAPRAFAGMVLIGSAGADYGERGYLTAYDAATGKEIWRFYTAPGDPARSFSSKAQAVEAKTWKGEWWKNGTGGTVWDSFTYDRELHRVYMGTANFGPEMCDPAGGDRLFLSSIVAVDARTGKYLWAYQAFPGGEWDLDATQNMVLADLRIGGRVHRVLMQANKNGFFYVLDRQTGKLISAAKMGKVTWARRIDLETGRPVLAPQILCRAGRITMWPSPYGAHNWQPMSFSPATGLAYIPYMKSAARFTLTKSNGVLRLDYQTAKIDPDDGSGQLLAWDPIAQRPRWAVPRDRMWNGGIASTAGNLVFQGDADGIFHAYDARDGRSLWKFDAKLGIVGAPVTYMVGGRQYVSVLVGIGGGTMGLSAAYGNYGWKYGAQPRRLLTFTLNGKAKLPPTAPRNFTVYCKDEPSLVIDRAAAIRGAQLFNEKFCSTCHGVRARGNGSPAPDLRESAVALHYDTFATVVRSGALTRSGMPKYDDLTDEEDRALFMFVRSAARACTGDARR